MSREPWDEDIWDRPEDARRGCFLMLAYFALMALIIMALVFGWRLP